MTRARDLADFNLDGKAVTINESSANLDFRVEGNGNANMLVVDAGNDRIGIATASPNNTLDVNGGIVCSPNTDGKDTFELSTNSVDEGRLRIKNVDTTTVQIRAGGDSYFNGGDVSIGTTSPDARLHVLSTSLPQTKIAYDSTRYMNIEHATIYNVSGASQSNNLKIASRGYSGGNDIIFSTGGTDAAGSSEAERMKILAGGNIDISAGHILLDNGYGINFAATSDASGMSSEILDDYEEGTWTASVVGSSGGTAQTMSGYYTKVGNKVYVHASAVSGLNLSSSSGVLVINGLPFTAKSTSYQLFHLAHNNAGTYPSGRTQAVGYVSGNTQIVGLCTGSGSAWGDFSIGSATSAGIIVSGTYEVA